jgi:hypothetical protein
MFLLSYNVLTSERSRCDFSWQVKIVDLDTHSFNLTIFGDRAIIRIQAKSWIRVNVLSAMKKQFEGRSLAHPGCLIGITTGLIVGIILAGVLASVFNVALNMVLLVWLFLTIGLGLLGWMIGERLSMKFFRARDEIEDAPSTDSSPLA